MAIAQHSIFLSRHGESEYMLKDLIGGDSPLTANGQAYAAQLPGIILPLLLQQDCCGAPPPVPAVLTSTLQRTIQTASHLAFSQQRLPALDEINAGVCEHMSYEQVQQTYPAVAQARARDKLGYRYPQGESYLDLVQRLWPVVHQLEHRHNPVVVVAHQAVLRVLVGLLCRKPLQEIPDISIPLHTVMQLTPTAAAPADAAGANGSSPYALTLLKPTNTQVTAAAATAAAAVSTVEPNAHDGSSSPSSSDSSKSSSCAAHAEESSASQVWPVLVWASCTSEAQGPRSSASLPIGQQA